MKVLNLVQGSPEWLKVREEHFNASEAPSIFGESKYKSRTALMNEKKGVKEVISAHLQKLFDAGHQTEDQARELLEFETFETLNPIVCTLEVEGLPLLASLDGIFEDGKTVFEHKLWNETLAENVRNNVLEPTYYWQLEQQLLVAGAERALFVVSDGTAEKREKMYYVSVPERRLKLIAGWHEFKKDLEAHEVKAKKEVVVANEQESFPVIKCSVEGSLVVSNLGEYIPVIKQLAEEQMRLILETDQDFADKEAFNKNVKTGRATLKTQATDIEKQFESLAEFNGFVKQADTILQKLQSHGEKQVKDSKAAKKVSIINNAYTEFNKHLAKLSETINKVQITQVVVDFEAVMKGKRSFEKMEEAVNSELIGAKLEANNIALVIRKNLDSLSEMAKDHRFLFSDHAMLLLKDNDDLINLIKARISEHEEAEAKRKAEEKAKIEAEAKAKAEKEAAAKLEREAQAIRNEERKKVETEQAKKYQEDMAKAQAETNKTVAPLAEKMNEEVVREEKPVEQRLAERFADTESTEQVPETKIIPEGGRTHSRTEVTRMTPHQAMIKDVNFWAGEYGVINSEYSDLMNIMNKYKASFKEV
tara:strand:- start:30138 stop:31910 length:1773 start_codon:yes stop_codon:yes gene_type:complete